MIRIFLSPSMQNNPYAYGNTTEGEQCARIAAAAAAGLTRCGFEVINATKWDYDDRVKTALDLNVDLYIPIHTNASPNHNVTGTRVFVRSFSDEPDYSYARTIFTYVDAVCPGTSSNIKTYARLWEFTHTGNLPAVYIECEFHDVPAAAEWIISHVVDIGEAITKGVCLCFGKEYIDPPAAIKVGDLVRIRAGAKNYSDTKTFAGWVYRSKLWVRQLNGARAVVSIYKTGDVTGAVNVKDLIKL